LDLDSIRLLLLNNHYKHWQDTLWVQMHLLTLCDTLTQRGPHLLCKKLDARIYFGTMIECPIIFPGINQEIEPACTTCCNYVCCKKMRWWSNYFRGWQRHA
jgi:hypothetical protein